MANEPLRFRRTERDPALRWSEERKSTGRIGSILGDRWSLLRFLLLQAAAVGVVLVSIVLDSLLRPSPGLEVVWQFGAFFAALFLSWQGLARFVPDLDRRWTIRRRR